MAATSGEVKRLDELARQHKWIVPDDSVLALTKAGEGNMNQVHRAALESGATLIFKESLPYVAKFPDIPAPIERIAVEASFYQAVKDTEIATRMPLLVGYAPDAHCLCLEDLGDGSDLTSLYEDQSSIDTTILADLLAWLGALHRIPIDEPNDFSNLAMRTLNHTHIFDLPFQPDNGLEFSKVLSDGWREMLDSDLREAALALGEIYLDQSPRVGVLLHGDFYPGSWLQTKDKLSVIDPEFGFFGPAEFDLGVFQAHLLLAGFSETDAQSIVSKYPRSCDTHVAQRFAGVEVLRRLFGVAQLPLKLDDAEKLELAAMAREMTLT